MNAAHAVASPLLLLVFQVPHMCVGAPAGGGCSQSVSPGKMPTKGAKYFSLIGGGNLFRIRLWIIVWKGMITRCMCLCGWSPGRRREFIALLNKLCLINEFHCRIIIMLYGGTMCRERQRTNYILWIVILNKHIRLNNARNTQQLCF